MIFTERTITIRKGASKINEPVILYRGDYEVEVRFTIMDSKFRFLSGVNVIDSEKASYAQLAILTPYGGNIFSEVTKCNEGTVTFLISKAMLDQIEEVGLYSFQIRLFDYNKESRASIPPVEFGLEFREPITSEDHDNSVNNAIVGYSIAKIVDPKEENVGPTFNDKGDYNKTVWETGDRISEGKLNKIEDAIDTINKNAETEHTNLDKRITSNYNVLSSQIDDLDTTKADIKDVNSKVWGMANMGQDVKAAMTGGSVAVVGPNSILNENIVSGQVTASKIANTSPVHNLLNPADIIYGSYYNGNNGVITSGASSSGLDCRVLIPCLPNTTYYRNKNSNVVLFDSAMQYLGRPADAAVVGAGIFTTTADTAYAGLSFTSSNLGDNTYIVLNSDSKTYSPYRVEWPDLMVHETSHPYVWLYAVGKTKFSVTGTTLTIEWVGSPRFMITSSFKSQTWVEIPATEPLVLNHNEMWVYNIRTQVFSIINSGSGSEYPSIYDGEICLLKNVDGKIVAGRLMEDINNRLRGDFVEICNDLLWTGAYITCETHPTLSGYNELYISGGNIYVLLKLGGTRNISLSGGKTYDIPVGINSQLIWDMFDNEIRVVENGSGYNVKPYEILLLYFQYGKPVAGALYKYLSEKVRQIRDNNNSDIGVELIDVYERYEQNTTIVKNGSTLTFTVDQTKGGSIWRVYALRLGSTGISYSSFIPAPDVSVDEITGEETTLTTTTFTLPHNGMLYLNVITKEFYTVLMTEKPKVSYETTGDILLLENIDGKIVAGALRDTVNDRMLKQEMAAVSSSNAMYDMGKLLFKFDVDPGGSYISSESMVGDELWVFPVSNDQGTNFIKAPRYKIDFENRTATYMGSFSHNWGHVNSSSYNPWRDALICGNGSGSYDLMGQIFIFENASSFKDRDQVNRNEAIIIDVQEWGYKANVIWGEANMGRGDICYVITNDAQNVRKLLLGMGSNNLGSGVMLSGKSDTQFNGTYKVLGTWTLPRIDVVQGSHYENGALYIGLGHDTAWYTKNHLHDDGSVTYETYKEKFYNADGSQLKCNMQGITVLDKYIILGLQGGGLTTNQIHVYYR